MIFIFKKYSEILLNSLSSVLSYNSFNLAPVLNLRKNSEKDKEQKKEEQAEEEQGEKETEDEQGKSEDQLHESTFMKQLIYFLLMTTMNAG